MQKSLIKQITIEDIKFFSMVLVICRSPLIHVEVGSMFMASLSSLTTRKIIHYLVRSISKPVEPKNHSTPRIH